MQSGWTLPALGIHDKQQKGPGMTRDSESSPVVRKRLIWAFLLWVAFCTFGLGLHVSEGSLVAGLALCFMVSIPVGKLLFTGESLFRQEADRGDDWMEIDFWG